MTVPNEVSCDVEYSSQQLMNCFSFDAMWKRDEAKDCWLFLRTKHYVPIGTSKNQVTYEKRWRALRCDRITRNDCRG